VSLGPRHQNQDIARSPWRSYGRPAGSCIPADSYDGRVVQLEA